MDAVRAAIMTCERCPRLRDHCRAVAREKRRAFQNDVYWGRPVPGFGDPGARLLIVGLAPAAHGANRTGRLFTGDGIGGSGDFLMRALHHAGFASLPTSREAGDGLVLRDAYIAAAVRCAPPANRPAPDEIAACRTHLAAELALLTRVRAVVALGRIAFEACLPLLRAAAAGGVRPVFGHGAIYRMSARIVLLGCYHPSRQNTHTGRLTPAMMDDVFRAARQLL